MKIDVTFVPAEVTPVLIKDKATVIIDVLRASTTIITAFENGASAIIPCAEIKEAKDISRNRVGDKVLLCGERDGRKIPGFALGNSPQEYIRENINNQTLIFTSTNGSRLFQLTEGADCVYVGALLNVTPLAAKLCQRERDIVLICAGNEDRFTLDDTYCAGLIINQINSQVMGNIELSDAARITSTFYQENTDAALHVLSSCAHGRYLASIGFESDLSICAQIDSYTMIPVYSDGLITV